MKQICLTLMLILVLQLGTFAFGQVPPAPQPVQMAPLIDFNAVFGQLFEMLRPHLVSIVGWGLGLFAISLCLAYIKGVQEKYLEERQRRKRIEKRVAMIEENRAATRLAFQREKERIAAEYRNRELQRKISSEGGSLAVINGDSYVRSESHGYVQYETLDQWRADRENKLNEPSTYSVDASSRDYIETTDVDFRPAVLSQANDFPRRGRHRDMSHSW